MFDYEMRSYSCAWPWFVTSAARNKCLKILLRSEPSSHLCASFALDEQRDPRRMKPNSQLSTPTNEQLGAMSGLRVSDGALAPPPTEVPMPMGALIWRCGRLRDSVLVSVFNACEMLSLTLRC